MKKTADAIEKFCESRQVACPHCGKEVRMMMLRSSNGLGMFGVSVLNYKHDLFAICPDCGALYGVDRSVSKKQAKASADRYADIPADSLIFQQVLPLKS
ncbi:MAG: zinc-ribbon domain-containing protein [Clostridia bacterium]|nr:zinc-ribbon domain-containing protein [Clostridia bacterium]